MKKTLFAMFAAALMMTGCSSDLEPEMKDGGNVLFTVQLPDGLNSRAYADGTTATKLTYALYNEDGTYIPNSKNDNVTFSNLTATVEMNLVTGKTYNIVFWAHADNAPYTFNENDATITVTTTGDANDENRDAFFACKTVVVNGPISETVTLTRPFAQINIGTSDLDDFKANAGSITTSGLKVKAANVLNLISGEATGDVEYTFNDATLPTQSLTVKNGEEETTLDYITMNYILMGTDKATVDVTWTSDNTAKPEVTFNSVPVQRNYRTNIYGALLTNPANFNVEIKPGMAGDDTNEEYDGEGFRVAHSTTEAQALLDAGYAKVSVDGKEFSSTASTASVMSLSRAGNMVEFYINKAVEHQILKITGTATADIKVSYKDATAAAKQTFTLIVTEKVNNVTVNLPGADVEINSGAENGKTASTGTITIESAATATVDSSVSADNVEAGDDFDGDFEVGVETVYGFLNAIASKGVNIIEVKSNLDLTSASIEDLTIVGEKVIDVANTATIKLPGAAYLTANTDLTLKGGGTITNEGTPRVTGEAKILLNATDGNLVLDNITMINDMDHHYHGSNENSTAIVYRNATNVTIKNSVIKSGEFAICAIPKNTSSGTIILEDSYFESTSSSKHNDVNWSYCVRLSGTTATLTNCEIKGVQGGLSTDSPLLTCTVKSGKYYTVNSELKEDAFYPVYVTNGSTVIIEGGEFSGARSLSNLAEGTSCVVSGDNDTNKPVGSVTITGGKFSGKAYNHVTNTVYQPDNWVGLENELPYIWTVK